MIMQNQFLELQAVSHPLFLRLYFAIGSSRGGKFLFPKRAVSQNVGCSLFFE